MPQRFAFAAFSIILFLLASTPSAGASVIVSPTSTFDGAKWTYDYSLFNSGSDGIFIFGLDVSGSVLSISSPAGWLASSQPVLSEVAIEWASNDASVDVLPSGTLSGFTIVSSASPGTVTYSAIDESLKQFSGTTNGPVSSAVPEPHSAVLIGMALLALAVIRCPKSSIGSRAAVHSLHKGPFF
jgi:hypothetical protein